MITTNNEKHFYMNLLSKVSLKCILCCFNYISLYFFYVILRQINLLFHLDIFWLETVSIGVCPWWKEIEAIHQYQLISLAFILVSKLIWRYHRRPLNPKFDNPNLFLSNKISIVDLLSSLRYLYCSDSFV